MAAMKAAAGSRAVRKAAEEADVRAVTAIAAVALAVRQAASSGAEEVCSGAVWAVVASEAEG